MGRSPCCDKSMVKRGLWTAEEDAKLLAYISRHGAGNWTSVPKKAGLMRCGKSCRLRWTNYLRPNLKHENFTPEEKERIIALHATIGSRWSSIANQLPGRTDNDVKNYWNTKLSKELFRKGIDPITHRPISQIIESIKHIQNGTAAATSSCCNASWYNCGRDLKNVFLSRPTLTINSGSGSSPSPNLSHSLEAGSPVTADQGLLPPYFSPSDSSYCSTAATTAEATAPPSSPEFKWSDFLVESIPCNDDDHDTCAMSAESKARLVAGNGVAVDQHHDLSGEHYVAMDDTGASCEGSSSFVDAILEQDRKLASKFYEFLSDPSDFIYFNNN